MAQQTIDIGTVANDGTGDPIRDAFDKCNDNFTELYSGLVGLLDFKGSTDCSANPNYPAASKGDFYVVSVAGKIGGASGVVVEVGDAYFAKADNAGGTQAAVGTSWTVIQANIVGTTISELDDVPDVNAPTPSDGDVLTWDATPGEWVAAPAAGGGGGATVIDDLTDVDTTTNAPATGEGLVWDGTNWVPGGGVIGIQGQKKCGARLNSSGGSAQAVAVTTAVQVTNLDTTAYDTDGFITTADQITIPAGFAAKLNDASCRWYIKYGIKTSGTLTAASGFSASAMVNGVNVSQQHIAIGYNNPGINGVSPCNPATLVDGQAITLFVQSQDSSYDVLNDAMTYLELVVESGPATEDAVDFAYQPTSGTSFPGSPTTGQRFFRTDRGIEYYWDGTRWLSTQLFSLPISTQDAVNPLSASSQHRVANPHWNRYAIYVERVMTQTYLTSGTTASNYFTVNFGHSTAAAAGDALGSNISSQSITQNSWTGGESNANEVVPSTANMLFANIVETGTATGYVLATAEYRLVG